MNKNKKMNEEKNNIIGSFNNVKIPNMKFTMNFELPSILFGNNKSNIKAEELNKIEPIENLDELFLRSNNENGNNIAFILKDKINILKENEKDNNAYTNITNDEYYNTFKSLAYSLYNKGLYKKRIGVISENRYEWTVSYASVVTKLGIVVPLDKNLPKEELKNIILRDNLSLIITSEKIYPTLVEILEELAKTDKKYSDIELVLMNLYVTKKEKENIDKILNGIDRVKENENNFKTYLMSNLVKDAKKIEKSVIGKYEKIKVNKKDLASVLYTSATTSTSKAVMLSHENLCTNVRDIASMFDLSKNDRLLSFLPIHHSFESTVGFLYPIFSGTTICYADSLRKIPDNLKEYEITAIISVPLLLETIYNRIMQTIKKSGKENQFQLGLNISNALRKVGIDKRKEIFKDIHEKLGGKLRLVVVGAAALTEETHKKLNEIGINVYQGYGLTETSPVLAAGHGKVNVPGSVGRVLPSVDIMIDKKEDEQIGEILAKGPSIMLGYENDEENNKLVFNEEGWLKTGDLGYFDKEGNLFISGRAKNVIVLKNGKNIFPDETEILLNNITGVTETMVFGYPKDEDKTDLVLYAKIVIDESKFENMTDDEIYKIIWDQVKEINRMQPTYKYIKKILISKEPLIKTTTLKVKRYEEMKKIEKELEKSNK